MNVPKWKSEIDALRQRGLFDAGVPFEEVTQIIETHMEKIFDEVLRIVGIHTSPHSLGNCEYCQIRELEGRYL